MSRLTIKALLAASAYVRSGCVVLTEHNAEWVSDRAGEDSKSRLALTVDTPGAGREQFLLSLVGHRLPPCILGGRESGRSEWCLGRTHGRLLDARPTILVCLT
jgi:hypothetical protein